MRVGQSRKRDSNEPAIVDALRRCGAYVMAASIPGGPDLLVLWQGAVYLCECKTRHGRPTKAQIATDQQGWPIFVVRTVEDALRVLGVRR